MKRKIFLKHLKLIKKVTSVLKERRGIRIKLCKFFYYLILIPFELIGDILFIWKKFFPKRIKRFKKILIIKIDYLGDVLFSTFLIPLIKEKYPEAEIHYLIHPKTKLLLEGNPNIRKIYFWQDFFSDFILGRKKENSFLSILKENIKSIIRLRREKYDIIINARPFLPSYNFFWKLISPKFLISFDVSEQSFLADYWADYDFYQEEWKNYLKLLRPLRIKKKYFCPQYFNFEIPKEHFKHSQDFVVISPVTFDKDRLWKIGHWQNVVKFLIGKNLEVFLIGLKNHRNYLLRISSNFDKEKVKILTNLSIPQLAYLTRHSKFVLAIDSFLTHLALALNKKIVCLVNEKVYYIKNFSPLEKFVGRKSLLPLTENIFFLSVSDNSSKMIKYCEKIIKDQERM